MAKGLKPGEKVIMINCSEAEQYKLRVWTVRSEPWKLGHGAEVVLLEGKSGGFDTSCLARFDPDGLLCNGCPNFQRTGRAGTESTPESYLFQCGEKPLLQIRKAGQPDTVEVMKPLWCPKRKGADS